MATKYPSKDVRWKWIEERGYKVFSDSHQLEYMKSLWAPLKEVQSVFVDAKSGTGKTSLAVAGGVYAVENQEYDKIIYVRNTVAVRDQGFLPGDIQNKEEIYYSPLFDALETLAHDGYQNWYDNDDEHKKIHTVSTSYLRGVNFKNAWIIVDEAQSMDLLELQTTLTRIHDSCKVIVIGSTLQNDNRKLKYFNGLSPFELYIKHFENEEDNRIHKLVTNFRGKFSQHSDEIGKTITALSKENIYL